MKAPAFWWRQGTLASALLAPAGWIWGTVAGRRMAGRGTLSTVPVVCIGNLVAGGAGKTPTALLVAGTLAATGMRPVFLSRGYGGTLRQPTLVDPGRHAAADCGDEPLLLAGSHPTVVSADRVAGAALAAGHGDVIVMDDGLQNPSLTKTLSIAVVDAARGVGNARCVPAGPLRAPLADQWQRIDALLLIGDGSPGEAVAQEAGRHRLTVLRGRLVPDPSTAATLRGRRVLAFAGIGDPGKFFTTLREAGAEVVRTVPLPDHATFSPGQVEAIVTEAEAAGLIPVTTEKDVARMPAEVTRSLGSRLGVLPVTLVVEGDGLERLLQKAVSNRQPLDRAPMR